MRKSIQEVKSQQKNKAGKEETKGMGPDGKLMVREKVTQGGSELCMPL